MQFIDWNCDDFFWNQIHRSTYDTYTAAVVEYNSKFGPDSVYENTANIVDVILSSDIKDVDILVFPEGCINDATVPVPITMDYAENMDFVVYNTAVVFDRRGAIIAK